MKYVDIVFDGPPGPEAGRFVEVEDPNGRGINVGEWIDRKDRYWALRIPQPDITGLVAALRDSIEEAHELHIYAPDDTHPQDCSYCALVKRANDFLDRSLPSKVKIVGQWSTRRVWIDDKEIFAEESLKLRNHSPDGFMWSYGGSGPSQLSLAILLAVGVPPSDATNLYQSFKSQFVSAWPKEDFEAEVDIQAFVEKERPY